MTPREVVADTFKPEYHGFYSADQIIDALTANGFQIVPVDVVEVLRGLVAEADSPAEPLAGKVNSSDWARMAAAKLGVVLMQRMPALREALAKLGEQS